MFNEWLPPLCDFGGAALIYPPNTGLAYVAHKIPNFPQLKSLFALIFIFYLVAGTYFSLTPQYVSCFPEGQENADAMVGWIHCLRVWSEGAESSTGVVIMGRIKRRSGTKDRL